MTERMPRRSWQPAREAPVLFAVQLVALWQASLRGLDPEAVPPAAVLYVTGSALVLIGVAGRWGSSVIVGHAAVACAYLGVGWSQLGRTSELRPLAGLALLVSVAGVTVLVRRRVATWVRLVVAVPAMVAGQLMLSTSLGADYRSATGLISAGLLHLVLAGGTALVWQRHRLAEVVERERVTRD